MDSELVLFWFTRVLHVGAAIVMVGGAFFLRFILLPAGATLPEAEHARLRSAVMAGWKRVVHAGIALLLISGLINYYRVISLRTHKGDGLYHALLGTKMLLALAIFFIASALVGRSARFEGLRANAKKWLAVNLGLALVIVAISGFLKVRGVPARAVEPATSPIAIPGDR
jgi:uncharacterized membrane protein